MPSRLKKEMGCRENKYTGLDTLININGYYTKTEIQDNRNLYGVNNRLNGLDTVQSNMIFYANGIFVDDVWVSHLESFGKLITFSDGIYSLSNDTIKTKIINNGRPSNAWSGRVAWYKILDKNTVVQIYERQIVSFSDRNKEIFQAKHFSDKSKPYKYEYIEKMPPY